MSHASNEKRFIALISGRDRGIGARLGRAGLRVCGVGYAAAMRGRNALFDRGLRAVHPLGRPTISVGNVTTGGTGKTPVVAWLADRLRVTGERPAILTRGYRATAAAGSDEARLLAAALGADVPVEVNADRVAGAAAVIARSPAATCFVLDDGFQHRRAGRDFDLVLIDATCPFGYGRVLPAGLLREPLSGLRRADAVLITRADRVKDIKSVTRMIRQHTPTAPIFQVANRLFGLIDALGRPVTLRRGELLSAVAGIGNPAVFFEQISELAARPPMTRTVPDHHDYTPADLDGLFIWAESSRAAALVTTEKDWVKLMRLPGINDGPVPVWRAQQSLDFQDGDEDTLLTLIRSRLPRHAYAGA